MLNKNDILGAVDTIVESVNVPEWKGTVYVRSWSALEVLQWETEGLALTQKGLPATHNLLGRFASKSIADEKGNRLFADTDADELGKKSSKALKRIFDVAIKLNAMDVETVKELEKN